MEKTDPKELFNELREKVLDSMVVRDAVSSYHMKITLLLSVKKTLVLA